LLCFSAPAMTILLEVSTVVVFSSKSKYLDENFTSLIGFINNTEDHSEKYNKDEFNHSSSC